MVPATVAVARRYAGLVVAISLLVCACGARSAPGTAHQPRATPSVSCNLYASPDGRPELSQVSAARATHHHHRGSLAHPFKSVQGLVKVLRPGQTGCLEPGTYDLHGELRFGRSGRPGSSITLAGYPSRHATLTDGFIEIPHGSNYVLLRGLRINSAHATQLGLQILGSHDALRYSNVTNHNRPGSCIIVGSDTGYGQASQTLIEGDVIHECGYHPGDPYEDHGVYVDNSVGAIIENNVFWGMPYGWGVQLYPHSVRTQVLHNFIVDNRQGVVFGGNDGFSSSGNLVAYNVIASGSTGYDLQSYWGGSVGTNNVAKDNCLYSRHAAEIQRPTKGFVATHNVLANPRFVNPAKHDYALRSGSPCQTMIDSGRAAGSNTH